MRNVVIYAGIGSRETPPQVLSFMKTIGATLAKSGYVLRSGGAKGADTAFEEGHRSEIGERNLRIFTADVVFPEWMEHASRFHPAWDRCSHRAKRLHARNSAIILGPNLNEPVDFVVCWTKNGKVAGGTGQGLRIANDLCIPVFNLAKSPDELRDLVKYIR